MDPSESHAKIFVGCAGWNIRKEMMDQFASQGSHLARYATRLNCVEINSSFYRSHRKTTYERWGETTPNEFRFAVKMPRQITHEHRLSDTESLVRQFLSEIAGLKTKLGAILVQLPPSLTFDHDRDEGFFALLRDLVETPVVCEPRHVSWFDAGVTGMLAQYEIGRVAADPAIATGADEPVYQRSIAYFRWHGSPQMYYSCYDDQRLQQLADSIFQAVQHASQAWCIFDNTAAGAAINNALTLSNLLAHSTQRER